MAGFKPASSLSHGPQPLPRCNNFHLTQNAAAAIQIHGMRGSRKIYFDVPAKKNIFQFNILRYFLCTIFMFPNKSGTKIFFFKNGPNPATFWFIFVLFSQHKDKYSTNFTTNDKSIDGVLGSRTRGGMMEGADESTELWRHPENIFYFNQ